MKIGQNFPIYLFKGVISIIKHTTRWYMARFISDLFQNYFDSFRFIPIYSKTFSDLLLINL